MILWLVNNISCHDINSIVLSPQKLTKSETRLQTEPTVSSFEGLLDTTVDVFLYIILCWCMMFISVILYYITI